MPADKLTPEVHNALTLALSAGSFRTVAAEAAGIHRSTLYAWLERGEADHANGKATKHAELYLAARGSEALAEQRALELIQSAAEKDWRAAAWYLERRYQDRWGGRLSVEHSGRVSHELGDKSDAELRELAGELADRRATA